MQQFIRHSTLFEGSNVTVYRPILGSAYAAVYHFSTIKPAPPVKEGEVPTLPPPVESIVFEYLTPRMVNKRQQLRAYRKHTVHPSDIITNADGTQAIKNIKNIFFMEEFVATPETMTNEITDPASVLSIKSYLDLNTVNL